MKVKLPQFHDRVSLCLGSIVGFTLVGVTVIGMFTSFRLVQLLPLLVGLILGIHCLDTLQYYRKHRIVRIVKTDTERKVYK